MLQRGLLQSLLFQALRDHRQYIRQVFPERWQRYNHLRRGLHDWTIAELQQALEIIISEALFRFMFFLDGLDQFEGNPQVLVEFVGRITEKITLSSVLLAIHGISFRMHSSNLQVFDWNN